MRELRNLLPVTYDFVCSIGCDCGCAWHLIKNRLRMASYPLDWVGTWYVGIAGVAELVAQDFDGFLKLENLRKEPNPPRGPKDDHEHDYYHDPVVGVDFAHDFPIGMPLEEAYPAVCEKYRRRIDRFYRSVRESRRTLLVYWTWRDHPERDVIMKAAETFRTKFPEVRIDLLVMRHVDGQGIRPEIVGDGVFLVDGPFHPEGGHPAFGDAEINRKVFSFIRLRGKRRRLWSGKLNRIRLRIVSAFILDRVKRHAYRERHSQKQDVF